LALSLILVLAFSMLVAVSSVVSADTLLDHTTYIYVVAAPNPIGVGQATYITFFLPNTPPAQLPLATPRFGVWNGITLTITKPDRTIETRADLSTSYAGAGTIAYVPSMAGIYTVTASFGGQTIATGPAKGQYYEPSMSSPSTFNATQTPIEPAINYPLPSNYWTFPIESQNRAWNIYSGNWLAGNFPNASMSSAWNPYTVGPYSAHILWAKQWVTGGLMGGSFGSLQYGQGRWPGGSNQYFTPFVANGILYVNLPEYYLTSTGGTNQIGGFEAISLSTGEVLWKNTVNDSIAFMQVFSYYSTMMSGGWSYLWSTQSGTTWRMYDTLTGNLVQTLTNVPTGGKVTFGLNGELCVYYLSGPPRNWISMWNSTYFELQAEQSVGYLYGPSYEPNTVWAPPVGTYNFSLGFQWNVTIPGYTGIGFTNGIMPNDVAVLSASIAATNTSTTMLQQMAISIRPGIYSGVNGTQSGQQAQVLWGPINRTTFIDNTNYERIESISYTSSHVPVYVMYSREKLQMVAYNAYTGAKMYTTEPFETAWSMFTGESNNIQAADGKLFAGGYDGRMHCYDLATGELLWMYYIGSAGLNTPYDSWVIEGSYSYYAIAGGMVIFGANEHSPGNPPWLGGQIWAVNETSGELVWKIDSFQYETQPLLAVDNQVLYLNFYDGKVYDIGRGPSATTVSAPLNSVNAGNTITLTGTVTDQSVGGKGTPAISDASMTGWMEYMYMQKPKPTDATGVQVTLIAIDSSNKEIPIGTATSDSNGNFGIAWTPATPGTYKIMATFGGTNSYWGSEASTYIAVQAAPTTPVVTSSPAATATPAATETPIATASPSAIVEPGTGISTETLLIAGAAAVIVIAVAAAALVLRKRK
jgi:hypothetical protein